MSAGGRAPIRVLIVDDAVVVRRIVTDVLDAEPDIEVVGSAPNGRVALSKIDQLRPEVLTLDVEMPEMDGLETLAEVRKRHPRLPVIMFSTLTSRGAAVTVEALLLGANDYVTKPANVGSVREAMSAVREQLVPKVHALGRRAGPPPSVLPTLPVAVPAARGPVATPVPRAPVTLVVAGVSTGGPNALAALIPRLPADLGVPVLIVQHMPPTFTRLLAERLDARSPLQVAEGRDGAEVRPGQVWIAPGDRHLEVARGRGGLQLHLSDAPPENSCRPAADVLFRSAAAHQGAGVLALVMTGMGYDGRAGAAAVRAAGGRVLAQDQASSVVWGMPGAVVEAGLADAVLPLDRLAESLIQQVRMAGRAPVSGRSR